MFDVCVDLSDILLGILVAGAILYGFYSWVKAGSAQWSKWDATNMNAEQRAAQASRIRYFLTPNKWLADTYPVALFWSKYYGASYGF